MKCTVIILIACGALLHKTSLPSKHTLYFWPKHCTSGPRQQTANDLLYKGHNKVWTQWKAL